MLAIDQILDLLKNGQWHELKEVADKTRLQELKIQIITSFLVEYDFLEFDKRKMKIRLSPTLQLFLRKIEDTEREKPPEDKRLLTMMFSSFLKSAILNS